MLAVQFRTIVLIWLLRVTVVTKCHGTGRVLISLLLLFASNTRNGLKQLTGLVQIFRVCCVREPSSALSWP